MIGELYSLRILILNSNKLETLLYPTDITIKKGLNGVSVSYYIAQFLIFETIKNLEILDVSNNQLKDFNGL